MNALKKAITILGAVIALLIVALVVLSLYALNRKEQNIDRIKPAAENRWKKKPAPAPPEPEPEEENEERQSDIGITGLNHVDSVSAVI